MNNTWIITDTHFDHENIGVYCDRPKGWMDLIISQWRAIVKPSDVVIHLGDVQVGRGKKLLELMESLPGQKTLVMGNHDTHSPSWYTKNGFAIACDALSLYGATFTHRPAARLFEGDDINVHGHVHNSEWKPFEPWQRLLAVEHVGYKPVNLMKWLGVARSSRRWKEYMSTWRTIKSIERLHNAHEN